MSKKKQNRPFIPPFDIPDLKDALNYGSQAQRAFFEGELNGLNINYLSVDEYIKLNSKMPPIKKPNLTKAPQPKNLDEAIHQAMFEALGPDSVTNKIKDYNDFLSTLQVKKPEEFKPSFNDLICHTLTELNNALHWSKVNPFNATPQDVFNKAYDGKINRVYSPDEIKSMAPKLHLVKIGMDIDELTLAKLHIPMKWIQNKMWNNHLNITKNMFCVLAYYEKRQYPYELFEFPTGQVNPVSDYILLIDPYEPSEPELTETILRTGGLHLVKKYDIKTAMQLLNKRKEIFTHAPTATNTILLFQLMDAIILNEFKQGTLDLDSTREKSLIRLEKLKNLAGGTKFNEERKLAVDNCFTQFNKLMIRDEKVNV